MGNSWRTTGDIQDTWESILGKLDNSVGLAHYAGPSAWNDLDILQVWVEGTKGPCPTESLLAARGWQRACL